MWFFTIVLRNLLHRKIRTGLTVFGMGVAVVSVVGIAKFLGASPVTILSIAPKSVTAPIAMGIAQKLGGLPALAAVFAVATGILGASIGKYVFDACRVGDGDRHPAGGRVCWGTGRRAARGCHGCGSPHRSRAPLRSSSSCRAGPAGSRTGTSGRGTGSRACTT